MYLLFISVHGLVRGQDLELGRDADTGGQIKYVLELIRSLCRFDEVERVDLVTRLVRDASVYHDYGRAIEPITEFPDKARIVRIEGGPNEYLPKEQLWDHLDILCDNLIEWLYGQPRMPDVIHGHYADGGYISTRIASQLGIPFILTGHSLGRDKRKQLLAQGMSHQEIEEAYNIDRRINAEEMSLANASLVIASTHHEVKEQYSLYNYYDPSRMVVIPPGTDLDVFHPPRGKEKIAFAEKIKHFLTDDSKPLILALSRPDERKNILTLIEAFGKSQQLQSRANLLIIAGNRDDIREMDSSSKSVLVNILMLIDTYNLYGKVAVPKQHGANEVPKIYRMVARSRGVFINPALTEPFGLTLLEAAASGLPVVATENGGPVDIVANCKNGILINPLDKAAMVRALLKLLRSDEAWERAAENGIRGVHAHYSWHEHARVYLDKVNKIKAKAKSIEVALPVRVRYYRNRAIFSSLDDDLIGNSEALASFVGMLRKYRKDVAFGIATARRIDSALAIMRKHNIPMPDILISSMGTRIHYGAELAEDDYWAEHINHMWNDQLVRRTLSDVPGLVLQQLHEQTSFKVSYHYSPEKAPSLQEIVELLQRREITANSFLSMGQLLDIIPSRASKGLALRYATQRLGIPLENTLVAGGSGGDEDMIRGNTLAVVIGNRRHEELSQLVDLERVYFADNEHAAGILEAIEHYNFFA